MSSLAPDQMNCIDPTQGNSNLISNQIYIYIKLLIHYFVHRMDHGDIKSEFVLKSSRLNYCQSSGVLWDQPPSIPERPGSSSQALVRQNQKAPIRESVNAVWLQHPRFSISSLFSEPDISSSKEEQRVTLMAFYPLPTGFGQTLVVRCSDACRESLFASAGKPCVVAD